MRIAIGESNGLHSSSVFCFFIVQVCNLLLTISHRHLWRFHFLGRGISSLLTVEEKKGPFYLFQVSIKRVNIFRENKKNKTKQNGDGYTPAIGAHTFAVNLKRLAVRMAADLAAAIIHHRHQARLLSTCRHLHFLVRSWILFYFILCFFFPFKVFSPQKKEEKKNDDGVDVTLTASSACW